jgi:hypothetical protein
MRRQRPHFFGAVFDPDHPDALDLQWVMILLTQPPTRTKKFPRTFKDLPTETTAALSFPSHQWLPATQTPNLLHSGGSQARARQILVRKQGGA